MVANVAYEEAFQAFRKLEGKESTRSFYTNHQHVEQMLSYLRNPVAGIGLPLISGAQKQRCMTQSLERERLFMTFVG
jgi:hypothetical protein